ncbi:two-component system response regulator LytT [Parabacteroides sp. PF5-5]|uniref:LytR/AlgR family response regulator transcription factor n=1 Tax=unclassified Parabacteroides TaxID=2649774 RepID=UPI0024737DE9|nr:MULTISPECIES: LytTR family DNA-binding domain-containing protein [unclassified Parabacteroides]MDH6303724.1 two-component system response regulator LytT [Parabacteroides sp. PH5-39]MDH6314341.1 two-component system response regulator LytT [Parabacteroides sp. PF5-13]MDH6318595.1 two-component system response regulator LytT [Parabacteroides sp. PH5-13]MDH6322113.1 two-component system response regulator LytT [Parabacteroides sp. PH5-8]MDH6325808.1 two-component system response regulator LytT
MKVLIVEDETAAYENLTDILNEINPAIEILGNTESITQTVQWLLNNPPPDLILMDIHLSDGSAFAIFQSINVETPIIFITAYDEYAIEAFKVNSIDYLLKPIKAEELERALFKFGKWTRTEVVQYMAQMTNLPQMSRFKDKMLIPVKDKLLPINMKDISCFYTTDKNTQIYLNDGNCYAYSKTLEQIASTLNPADFIRANKQFIISRDSVKNITIWFDNRLMVTLDIETPERIYISKNKAAEFKSWVVNDN